jgi:hypothetical protein
MAEIETRQQLIKHLIRAAQRMVFEERDSRYIETAIETYLNKHQEFYRLASLEDSLGSVFDSIRESAPYENEL